MLIRKFIVSMFKVFLLLFVAILIVSIALIYSRTLQSFVITALSEKDIKVERDITYHSNKRNKLDIYYPKTGDKGGPLIIFYYGGGWRSGRKALYHFVGASLAKNGYTTVIPDYRLYPDVKFPLFVEDAAKAYQWVWQKFIKDQPSRPIVVMGHSAGAHIAALLSYDRSYISALGEEMTGPSGLVGLAGPYSFDPTTWHTTREIFSDFKNAPDKTRPVSFVNIKSPKSLLFHGLEDTTVKIWNAETLSKELAKVRVSNKLVRLEGIGHIGIILTMARPFRWRAPVLDEIKAFIKTYE